MIDSILFNLSVVFDLVFAAIEHVLAAVGEALAWFGA